MQQIALRPHGHAAFGAERHHAIVLVDQVDAARVDDEIIHRTQLAFPDDLTGTQIQRRQVAVVTQRVDHAVNDHRRGVHVVQAIDFGRAARLRNALLPDNLALLHQHGADAAVVTADDGGAKGDGRRGFTAQRQRRHIQVNRPLHRAVGFVQRLQHAVGGMHQHHAVADNRTGDRFAGHFGLPGDGAVGGVQCVNHRFFAADVNLVTRNRQAARQQRRQVAGEEAGLLGEIDLPLLVAAVGVHRFHDAKAIGGVNGAVLIGRAQVGVILTDTVAHRGAPRLVRRKLIFNFRQRRHGNHVFFAVKQRATTQQGSGNQSDQECFTQLHGNSP
ncbi:Uncharacterised protein [Acinetobacter baumannii]|nr:Uncharacterised protein [Acinetobacter baumannii]